MAPEQEVNAEAAGPRADLYSLAAILYELLMGVPPRGRWELPSRARGDVPAALDAFLQKALQAPPDLRHADAREFERELRRALRSAEEPTTPPPPEAPPAREARKKRRSRDTVGPPPEVPPVRSSAPPPARGVSPPPVVGEPPLEAPPAAETRDVRRPRRVSRSGPLRILALAGLDLACLGVGYLLYGLAHARLVEVLFRMGLEPVETWAPAIGIASCGLVAVLLMILAGRVIVPGFRLRTAIGMIVLYEAVFLSVIPLGRLAPEQARLGWLIALAAVVLLTVLWQAANGRRAQRGRANR
jgi:hypothetical protein